MKNKNKKANLFLFTILLTAGFFGFWDFCSASSSIIINEIQITGVTGKTTYDDFIEPYNLSDSPFNLKDHQLVKRTAVGTSDSEIVSWNENAFIPPRGFYLWANNNNAFADSILADISTDKIISENNGVALKSNFGEIIDSVGWGNCQNIFVEKFPFPQNPGANKSIERKNYQDSSDNSEDFEINNNPNPRNSTFIEKPPKTYSTEIIINELLPDPEGRDEEGEFIELYNSGNEKENLRDWKLEKRSGKFYILPDKDILPGEYWAIYYKDSKITLHNTNGEKINLYNPAQELVSFAEYTESAKKNYSWSFDGENWIWTSIPTPGGENEFDETEDSGDADGSEDYDYKIRLNEILPNPKGDEKLNEYIEIYNGESFEIDLGGWILGDASTIKSKTKKGYSFPEDTILESGKYSAIYRTAFKFALNNSGQDSVYLMDPDENIISSVTYADAKENVSYNSDGETWRWSRFLTPGKENKFNSAPKIKIKKIKDAYAGMPVFFSAETKDSDKDKLKFVWNFGDGKRSYLQEVFHTYLKKKKYTVSLTVDDGSEKAIKEFTVEVKKYPSLNLKIIRLLPNPAGTDTGNEWIEIKNNEKKKANLKSWKIATGAEKLINHAIADDFEINPGQARRLTRENAFFYLNNKAMKLELRYPNGKTADAVTYAKETIADDEIYEKTKNGWRWIIPRTDADETRTDADTALTIADETRTDAEEIVKEDLSEFIGGWSEDKSDKISREELLNYGTQVKLAAAVYSGEGKVLGASVENNEDSTYRFAASRPSDHYAVKFFKSVFSAINYSINKLIGGFF